MLLETDAASDQTFSCSFFSPQFAGLYLWKELRGSWIKILVWKLCVSLYKLNYLESQTNVRTNIACLANTSHLLSMQSFTHLRRQKFRLVLMCLLPALSLRGLLVSMVQSCWDGDDFGYSSCLVWASKHFCVYCSWFCTPRSGFWSSNAPTTGLYSYFFKSKFSPKLQESSITRQLLSLKISLLV